MIKQGIDVRSVLLMHAKKQFLEHGFEGTSLRGICKSAGLTTGAFYTHFSKREDLFDAMVEPMLKSFHAMYQEVIQKELLDLSFGIDNEMTSITYAIEHKDEFRLLFDCSKGTKYEGFKEKLLDTYFYPGYQRVFDQYAGRAVDPRLVKIILRMKFEEYMALIYGEESLEEVRKLTRQLTVFSLGGFRELLRELENRKEDEGSFDQEAKEKLLT